MRHKFFLLIFYAVLLICSMAKLKEKSPQNLQKKNTALENINKNNINPRKLYEYDNYITIYFKEDVTYESGFSNIFRKNISFIINTQDNTEKIKEEQININKDYGIQIHFSEKVTTLFSFFSRYNDQNMQYLISVDFSNLDSSSVSNMATLFQGCNSLEYIDFSNFDSSSASEMGLMFEKCSSLEYVDLSSFNTPLLFSMGSMFAECSSLKSIDLSNFDTSNLYFVDGLFYECTSLKSINIPNFLFSFVSSLSSMFSGCEYLESIDLSNIDTSLITCMEQMFRGCSSLKPLDLSNLKIPLLTDIGYIFHDCISLE